MVALKPAVMILHIILAEKELRFIYSNRSGELLKFVKKEKVKIFRLPVHSKNPIVIIFNALIIINNYFF